MWFLVSWLWSWRCRVTRVGAAFWAKTRMASSIRFLTPQSGSECQVMTLLLCCSEKVCLAKHMGMIALANWIFLAPYQVGAVLKMRVGPGLSVFDPALCLEVPRPKSLTSTLTLSAALRCWLTKHEALADVSWSLQLTDHKTKRKQAWHSNMQPSELVTNALVWPTSPSAVKVQIVL